VHFLLVENTYKNPYSLKAVNSEADELATIGLERLQEKPMVPLDPDAVVQFHIEGRTITRDFKKTVRETIQLKPLQFFYCNRFEWSGNIFDAIDWEYSDRCIRNI
jgi:hypothetical protein